LRPFDQCLVDFALAHELEFSLGGSSLVSLWLAV